MTLERKYRALDDVDNDIIAFIRRYKLEHGGQSPTVREIGHAIGRSTGGGLLYRLKKLSHAGVLVRGAGARSLTIRDDAPSAPPIVPVIETAAMVAHTTNEGTPLLRIVSSRLQLGKRYRVTISEVVE